MEMSSQTMQMTCRIIGPEGGMARESGRSPWLTNCRGGHDNMTHPLPRRQTRFARQGRQTMAWHVACGPVFGRTFFQ